MKTRTTRNYYEILGVDQNATEIEIKKAYRNLALRCHPDRNPDESAKKQMQKLNKVYETLSNPQKREQYNKTLPSVPTSLYSSPKTTSTPTSFTPTSSTTTTSSDIPQDKSFKINLPTAVLFTGKPIVPGKGVDVILLATVKAGKSKFLRNLQDKFDFPPLWIDFVNYGDLPFRIYDLAGQERFKVLTKSYFRQAAIILFFDELAYHIDQCKMNLPSFEQCQVFPLSYSQNACQLNAPLSLHEFNPIDITMQSCEAYTAHLLSKALFVELEKMIMNPIIQNTNINQSSGFILDEPKQSVRPGSGCC